MFLNQVLDFGSFLLFLVIFYIKKEITLNIAAIQAFDAVFAQKIFVKLIFLWKFVKLTMSTRVYVGGLSHRTREKDIERFFRKFGRIREISLKVSLLIFVYLFRSK